VTAACAALAVVQALGAPLVAAPSADGTAPTTTAPTAQLTTTAPTAQPTTTAPTAQPTTTAPTTSTDESARPDRYSYAIGDGADRTVVYVHEADRPGPTVVVVGGQHGNEPAGYLAARDVADWSVERGTLVVVPQANPRAIRAGTRFVDGRDLNRQYPVGAEPTSAQARAIWGVVLRHDANAVIDLHSSRGTYHVDGVGQAVFPTVTGDAVAHADTAVERVNRRYGLEGDLAFRRGNVMDRSGTKLARKVAGDLNEPAYIVETTRRDTDLEARVAWTKAVTWELLRAHGLVSGESPVDRHSHAGDAGHRREV
jgi:hypothetical protein